MTCSDGAATGSQKMSERSEPKQVCRRSALAFLGCAAVFGLVASSALLTVTEAEAQATTTPPRRRRRPQIRRSLVPSGVRNGERGEQNGVRNAHGTHRAASGAAHRTRRATGRARRHHHPPPSKKSNRSFAPTTATGPSARAEEGRTAPVSAGHAGCGQFAERDFLRARGANDGSRVQGNNSRNQS